MARRQIGSDGRFSTIPIKWQDLFTVSVQFAGLWAVHAGSELRKTGGAQLSRGGGKR